MNNHSITVYIKASLELYLEDPTEGRYQDLVTYLERYGEIYGSMCFPDTSGPEI